MKIIKYLTFILAGLILVSQYSCEEDSDRLIFDQVLGALESTTGHFSVQDVADATYEVTVQLTNPAKSDVVFSLTVIDSLTTAVAGTHYSIPANVTVLTGAVEATFAITGIYSGFTDDIVTLAIQLGGDVFSQEKSLLSITMQRLCVYPMDDLAGDYTGTSPYHAPTITMETTDNPNELRVYGLGYFVPTYWGENWTSGDGSCLMEFACGDIITIRPQWIGDSDFPDVYGIIGDGTVDVAGKVITLNWELFYGWDGSTGTTVYDVKTTTLTLNGKMLEVIEEIKAKNK